MSLSTLAISSLDLALFGCIAVLTVIVLLNRRRIDRLESRLEHLQLLTTRELKMVNQGSIGMGRRFAVIEKQLKNSNNVAKFEAKTNKAKKDNAFDVTMIKVTKAAHEAKSVANLPSQSHSEPSSQAEKALTEWVKANQTA